MAKKKGGGGGEAPSKKAQQKKKVQAIEDKTFGLKNKNKSKKVGRYSGNTIDCCFQLFSPLTSL